MELQSAREELAKQEADVPNPLSFTSPHNVGPITVNVVDTRGRSLRTPASKRSSSMPSVTQRPTSSNSGVCYASPAAGPSQASTPILGINMIGVTPGPTPGPASLSSDEASGLIMGTQPSSTYCSNFKVDETLVGYRLVQGARVPVMASKRDVSPNISVNKSFSSSTCNNSCAWWRSTLVLKSKRSDESCASCV